MAQKKYLDQNGLSYLWGKIKGYVNDRFVRKSLDEKTYTGIIGTASTAADASFYFCNVKPDDYYTQWHVRLRVYASVPGQTAYEQRTDIAIQGYQSNLAAYSAENANTGTRSYCYINLYRATKAGVENSIGHIIGVGLRASTNPINTAYARTFKIELLEESNCSVELWDEMMKYASAPGTGSTNFSGLLEINAYSNGNTHTGDANNYDRLLVYNANFTAGTGGIMMYSLFMEDENGTYQSVVTTSGTGTAKAKNTCGFRPGKLWYMHKSSNIAAGANATPAYKAMLLDSRYSLNAGNTLTNHKALYLVFTERDGLLYLADPWWTQDLPSENDGYVYLYTGMIYANGYNLFLEANNPMYRYIDGRVVEYIPGQETGVIGQAHGKVVSFSDGTEGKPLKALTVGIEPVQDLHGYDAPWPAGGGKNKFDPSVYSDFLLENGKFRGTASQIMKVQYKIPHDLVGSPVTFSAYLDVTNSGALTYARCEAYVSGEAILGQRINNGSAGYSSVTFTPTSENDYVRLGYGSYGSESYTFYDIQLESGSAATAYSPYENLCQISGWTGAKVYRTGKNLSSYNQFGGSPAAYFGSNSETMAEVLKTLPVGSYTLTHKIEVVTVPDTNRVYHGNVYIRAGSVNVTVRNEQLDTSPSVGKVYTQTTRFNITQSTKGKITQAYFYADGYNNGKHSGTYKIYDIQIEQGTSASDFEPYQGDTFDVTFPTEAGTVYGGTLDVTSGVLTVDRAMKTFSVNDRFSFSSNGQRNRFAWDSYESIGKIAGHFVADRLKAKDASAGGYGDGEWEVFGSTVAPRCWIIAPLSIATVTDFIAWLADNPVQLIYELASPIVYQLTPTEITTLLGANTVWADTGDILELEYVRGSAGDIEYIVSQSDAKTVNGHTVQSDVPANAVFTDTNTTYALSQDAEDGHKITLTPSSGNPTTITIPDNNTTYSPATSSADGLMSAADKEKLDDMSCTRVYDDTLEYKTQSGWSPVDITLQPFTAVAEAPVEWELGAIVSSSGANSNSSTRLRTVAYLPAGVSEITPTSGYRFVLMAYDDGTYIGAWNGTSYVKSATWLTAKVETSDLGQHDFRIVLARNPDSGGMTVNEKSNITITQNVRMTVNDLVKRTISLEKALMGIDLSDPESAIYALALRVAQLEAHAILDSGYPSESSS